jgi:hypothetical protein
MLAEIAPVENPPIIDSAADIFLRPRSLIDWKYVLRLELTDPGIEDGWP